MVTYGKENHNSVSNMGKQISSLKGSSGGQPSAGYQQTAYSLFAKYVIYASKT